MPLNVRGVALVVALTALAALAGEPLTVDAVPHVREDARLLATLRADPVLRSCSCLLGAAWLDETYPRITVDPPRWRRLSASQREQFGARALHDVRAVYLAEWGTQYFYDQVFFVDSSGRQLFAYAP
jgi:hypothetical protein